MFRNHYKQELFRRDNPANRARTPWVRPDPPSQPILPYPLEKGADIPLTAETGAKPLGHAAVIASGAAGATFLHGDAGVPAQEVLVAKRMKPGSRGNILLAEKDPVLRAVIRRALLGADYMVFEAEDGHQAFLLSETLALPLNLLLTDAVLDRHLSGVELSRHLRVLRPGLRVLYLSGVPADPALRRELESKLDSYLSKPFTAEGLLAKVEALLRAGVASAPEFPAAVRRGFAAKGTVRIFPHGKAGGADWRAVVEQPGAGPVLLPDP